MIKEHTLYEAEMVGVLLGLHMVRLEKRMRTVRLTLDNQAVIVVLDICKPGPAQYLADEILCQTQALWNQVTTDEYRLEVVWVKGQ